MKTRQTAPEPLPASDLFSGVRPTGFLGRCLEAISNPRKHRWKAYLRACKRIPKSSPVYGSTSFDVLNNRRLDLCEEMFAKEKKSRKEVKESPEFQALQNATSQWLAGPRVAELFLLSRQLRRLKRLYPENVRMSDDKKNQ